VIWTLVAILAAAAFALTLPLVEIARRAAVRAGIVDYPNARSSHREPTPRGGGVAMVVSVLSLLAIVAWQRPELMPSYWLALIGGAILVAVVSGIDDWRSLSPAPRLAVHFGAAVLALLAVQGGDIELGAGAEAAVGVFALLWIVGMINAYNFMDGIDGLAASTGVVAGVGWIGLSVSGGEPAVALTAAALTGACAGFLVFNWSPARVFMGDLGSAFLGYWLGVLSLAAGKHDPGMFLPGVLIMWPFVFDTTATLIRRALRGENPLHPHRTHLYQRLVGTGLGHSTVAAIYAGLACVGVCTAVLLKRYPDSAMGWLLVPVTAAGLLWWWVARRERRALTANRSYL